MNELVALGFFMSAAFPSLRPFIVVVSPFLILPVIFVPSCFDTRRLRCRFTPESPCDSAGAFYGGGRAENRRNLANLRRLSLPLVPSPIFLSFSHSSHRFDHTLSRPDFLGYLRTAFM